MKKRNIIATIEDNIMKEKINTIIVGIFILIIGIVIESYSGMTFYFMIIVSILWILLAITGKIKLKLSRTAEVALYISLILILFSIIYFSVFI